MERTQVVIMAGGKGTRMRSERPKVLTDFNGEPIISRILRAVAPVCPDPLIIIGFKGEEVIRATGDAYEYAWQEEQLGTGHAVLQARPHLKDKFAAQKELDGACIAVLPGDHPLITTDMLRGLIAAHRSGKAPITITTIRVPEWKGDYMLFYGYGRVLRDSEGRVRGIRELKDASQEEKDMTEVNVGCYCFQPEWLWRHIETLHNDNKAREYYLTDLAGVAAHRGENINTYTLQDPAAGMGVNTAEELAIALRYANGAKMGG